MSSNIENSALLTIKYPSFFSKFISSLSTNLIYSKSSEGFIKTCPSTSILQLAYLISSTSVFAPLNTT